jgi:hypothetical protein
MDTLSTIIEIHPNKQLEALWGALITPCVESNCIIELIKKYNIYWVNRVVYAIIGDNQHNRVDMLCELAEYYNNYLEIFSDILRWGTDVPVLDYFAKRCNVVKVRDVRGKIRYVHRDEIMTAMSSD